MRLSYICSFAALVVVLGSCGKKKDQTTPPEPPSPPKDLVCEEGTDPNAPPPPGFDADCEPLESSLQKASVEFCDENGFLFSEDQKLCVKPEDCAPPFQPDGKLCKGSGGGSTPGCHSPTPYRRCTASGICYCSSTP